MSVGKNARVEGKVTLSSRKRDNDQGSNSINPGIFYECLQIAGQLV